MNNSGACQAMFCLMPEVLCQTLFDLIDISSPGSRKYGSSDGLCLSTISVAESIRQAAVGAILGRKVCV